jgi:hypothetical protein
MRAKSRRYEKPLSIKMVRHLHRAVGNPLFRQRVKPSTRLYNRKRQSVGGRDDLTR